MTPERLAQIKKGAATAKRHQDERDWSLADLEMHGASYGEDVLELVAEVERLRAAFENLDAWTTRMLTVAPPHTPESSALQIARNIARAALRGESP
jgi:cob(I)alamin adenosyltransferase